MNTAPVASSPVPLRNGDRVNWNHRPAAGYGFGHAVAAVVRKFGAKRVQIEVRRKPPYGKTTKWLAELKWVPVDSLRPRWFPCAAFDEAMEMRVGELVVKGWRHPFGATNQYPQGIWYGEVDGFQCTAPCFSEEQAVRSARHAAIEGGYRAAVQSAIEVRERWIATDQDKDGKGAAELPELRSRLEKLAASAGVIEELRSLAARAAES